MELAAGFDPCGNSLGQSSAPGYKRGSRTKRGPLTLFGLSPLTAPEAITVSNDLTVRRCTDPIVQVPWSTANASPHRWVWKRHGKSAPTP